MNGSARISLTWAGGILAGSALFLAGRAFAGGIPAQGALTYAGTLQDMTGKPALQTGEHNVAVRFYDAASGGALACDSGTQDLHVDASGHFSVTLPDACATQVSAKPNLWSDIVVDGNSLGRAKIGAVPYAIEAKHATSADTATKASDPATGGSIEARLAALEAKPAPLTTVFRTSIAAGDGSHAATCISAPDVINCAVAAGRKCVALGYAEGWFEGESGDGAARTIVCVK
ncbi:MAG TPA: hypothetical protein VIW29_12985 [Polyangiaceae bacterium]